MFWHMKVCKYLFLHWKSLLGTNTLAYYENSYFTDIKSFTAVAQINRNDTQPCLSVCGEHLTTGKLNGLFTRLI